MNHRRHTILLAFVAYVLFVASWRHAAGQSETPAGRPTIEGPIEYVGPDTYILLDAQGRPQPVLGMTYEEFVTAWKQLEVAEAKQNGPRFTIDRLRVSGETRDDRAELEVELTIRTHAGGLLKVPLGMADAILLEEPRLQSIGDVEPAAAAKSFVGYEPEAGGFVAWLAGQPSQRHQLTMRIVQPLMRGGNESSLQLNLPRTLRSSLSLTVPMPIVGAATTAGALLTKETTADGGTRLDVDGPSGDFRLSWNTSAASRPELATVLSATGAIAISIDGHSIRSDARLSVRSYGGTFDRCRVRLPPGARLIQDRTSDPGASAPNFRITVDEPSAADDGSQIVTIELAEKQLGPVDVELSTEQPLGLPTADRTIELAGFEVLGAVRQFGDVAIVVAEDWQLRWENGPDVRQVERAELPTSLRDLQPVVAFQYDRQPWSLRTQLVARPMVVHVTPDYALDLGIDEARLRVRLDYQVPGARAFEFHVQLAGWELTPEPIESNGLVDRDRVLVTHDGLLVLPLAQASSRRAEIAFNLRRAVARDATALELPLPVPESDTVAAAELVVAADAAIELLPDVSESRGLSPTPVTGDAPLDAAADGRQQFRFRALMPGAVFAAKRSIRPSETTAEIDTRLAVDWRQMRATQDAAYRVQYQPLEELTFELPDGWSIAGDQFEIVPATPGSEPIVVAAVTEPASHGRPTRIARATLAQPRLGQFHVRATYEITESAWLLSVEEHSMALPRPVGARITGHRVEVSAASNMSVSLDAVANSTWLPLGGSNRKSRLVVLSGGPPSDLPLVVEPIARDRPQAATVERVWLQTWQVGDTIQDRAAIKFRTTGADVTVELPPLSTTRDVEVLFDGELASTSTRQDGRLIVELSKSRSASEVAASSHTLELRYRRPAPVGLVTRHALTPPQLVGGSTLSEVYWQVVLPGDRHIIQTPDQLLPLDPRQWLEAFSGRRASKSQAELEAWVGATNQLGPSSAQSSFLFSGLAPVASIELLTAPRWLIVLVASGVILAVVSLWMYVPVVRRGWIAILFAVLVAGLAIAYPTPAVLLGQASVLGVFLAAIALALRRWTASRTALQPPPTAGSTNIRLRSSLRTDSFLAPLPVPSNSSAPTSTLAAPEVDR